MPYHKPGSRRGSCRARFVVSAAALAATLAFPASSPADLQAASGPSDRGAPEVWTETNREQIIFDREPRAELSYRVRDDEPVDVQIKLIEARTGNVVERWSSTVGDADVHQVGWRGVVGGDLQEEKTYAFRLTAQDSGGARTESADAGDTQRDSFKFRHNRFPIRGRHDYGSEGSRFGAARSGHSHQGQDVFAACGTKLQAARGGKVQYSGYHSSAGNYVVIDGKQSGRDYAYMHLDRNEARTGERVHTGELIGTVGDSGNASGCHLHFEIWTDPGWYEGGHAIDPLKFLRHWDRYS